MKDPKGEGKGKTGKKGEKGRRTKAKKQKNENPPRNADKIRIQKQSREGLVLPSESSVDPHLLTQWCHPVVGLPYGHTFRSFR
jgi:hypothetical protein